MVNTETVNRSAARIESDRAEAIHELETTIRQREEQIALLTGWTQQDRAVLAALKAEVAK